ncbi:hypothetical protein ES703_18504 [subsurface metagenome]
MTPREKIQFVYELAFHPPRLNAVWNRIKIGDAVDKEQIGELLNMALLLHQALPEDGYSSKPKTPSRSAGKSDSIVR